MHQERFWRDSRSLPKRSYIAWISIRNWSNWRSLIQMDKDAQKDFTYRMTQDEYFRYKKNWWISFNKSGRIGPLRNRSDLNDALTTWNRLEKNNSGQFHSGNTSNGTHHQVLPPARLGGNGTILGGAHDKQESPQLSSCKERHDRTGRPVVSAVFHKTSDVSTCKFFGLLQLDRLLLTVVCCNRRVCEHHTSHVHFSQWITCTWLKFGSALISAHPCFMRIVVVVSDCCLFDNSIFFFFLTIFSLITLCFLLPVNFIFQDVVDKFPVHFRQWGPWHPCRVRPSHTNCAWSAWRCHSFSTTGNTAPSRWACVWLQTRCCRVAKCCRILCEVTRLLLSFVLLETCAHFWFHLGNFGRDWVPRILVR